MRTILTERVIHRGKKRIKLIFNFDVDIMNVLDTFDDVAWSETMSCWHIDFEELYVENLQQRFKGIAKITDRTNNKKRTPYHDIGKAHKEALNRFEIYLKNRRYSPSTIAAYKKRIRDFLGFYFDKEIDLISNEDVQYFNYEQMIKTKASHTVQNMFITSLKLFLNTVSDCKIEIDKLERAKNSRKLPEVF